MKSVINNIVFIANPFGFGPAGTAIILIEELRKKWSGKITFIASQKCLDILPKTLGETIDILEIDERNPVELTETLSHLTSSLAVIVLNKTAIKTAHNLGIKAFFIDPLSWMWQEIPGEYLSANTYYYYDIFGVQKRLQGISNAHPISPILGELPKWEPVNGTFLVHIGGFSNPFVDDNTRYLRLLNELLEHIDNTYKVAVVGGKSGINFLKEVCSKLSIDFLVLDRKSFLERITHTERFITTSGLTAVFESFMIGTPVSFLPPTNLSQWKQLKLFLSLNAAPLEMQWERYFPTPEKLKETPENEALREFSRLSEVALQNQNVMDKMRSDFANLFSQEANFKGQNDLIVKNGDGSSEIISDILNVVSSSGI